MIVPSLPPRQRRILERWNPSTPLAQITKHRNSWRITTKKKIGEKFFLFQSRFTPKSFLERNESENPFDKGVALTSASGHRGPARKCWTIRRANVDSYVVATASKTGGLVRIGCFPSVCLRLALEMKASGGGGVGAGAWIFGGASPCAVVGLPWPYYGLGGPSRLSERQKAAWCQLGWSEQTYASLRKILIKVHIDAIN